MKTTPEGKMLFEAIADMQQLADLTPKQLQGVMDAITRTADLGGDLQDLKKAVRHHADKKRYKRVNRLAAVNRRREYGPD